MHPKAIVEHLVCSDDAREIVFLQELVGQLLAKEDGTLSHVIMLHFMSHSALVI